MAFASYDVKIVALQPATSEELMHGHAHIAEHSH
jgi:FKBP-type peptidyl-prolyl cis-trans isomerase 2